MMARVALLAVVCFAGAELLKPLAIRIGRTD